MIINSGFIGGKVGAYTSSVWEFNFSDSTWAQLFSHEVKFNKKDPIGRMGAGSAIVGNSLFIFGGTDSNKRFNDLWEFDLITKIWKEITQKIISMLFVGHAISRRHEFTNKKLGDFRQ